MDWLSTMGTRPYILVLSGPAGSGKSTVAVQLWKSLLDRPAYIDLDALKNFIWSAPSTDHHLDLASLNALCLTQNYLRAGHSVILDKAFGHYPFVQPFLAEAAAQGATAHYFKLTASLPVLVARNARRREYTADELLENARWRRYCAPDENVERIYRFFEEHAHPQGVELDTEQLSLNEVVAIVREAVEG